MFLEQTDSVALAIRLTLASSPDAPHARRRRTTAGSGPRFALIVHHDDATREFASDRTSHVGKLDKAFDEATAKGWTVVRMKDDWATISPPDQ